MRRRIIAASIGAGMLAVALAPASLPGAPERAAAQTREAGPSHGGGHATSHPGGKPHLLMIHGGGFLHRDPWFRALSRRAAVRAGFVPHYLHYPLGDMRGAVAAARFAARELRWRFGPRRVYAYGSSSGGTLAALLSASGLVRAAVAKAPIPDLWRWRRPPGFDHPEYFESIRATPAMRRRFSPLRRQNRNRLLIVQGRRDRVSPPGPNSRYAKRFRAVRLVAVPGGHWTERRRPRVLRRALRWLAAEARAARAGR